MVKQRRSILTSDFIAFCNNTLIKALLTESPFLRQIRFINETNNEGYWNRIHMLSSQIDDVVNTSLMVLLLSLNNFLV